MRIPMLLFISICIVMTSGANLFAEIINVPDDAETIQEGIDAAEKGDTVLVAPGVYVENVDFPGGGGVISVTLASRYLTTGNTMFVDSTIIDGDGIGFVLDFNDFHPREGKTLIVIGLTIQGGRGAGLYSHNVAGTTLRSCVFRDNVGIAAVYLEHGENLVEDCVFFNNSGDYGGAIHCYIQEREGYQWGTTIRNTVVVGNSADFGGGIYASYSGVNIINCTIANNISEEDMGGGIFCTWSSNVQVINSIVWNNTPDAVAFDSERDPNNLIVSYSDFKGGEEGIEINDNGEIEWGEGIIDEDPLFVDPDNGDYHLTEDSPCINAGDPNSPDDPDGSRADMGAFWFDHRLSAEQDTSFIPHPSAFILSSVYPNPFNSHLSVNLDTSLPVQVSVYDPLGRVVKSGRYNQRHINLSFGHSNLPAGTYFLYINDGRQDYVQRLTLLR